MRLISLVYSACSNVNRNVATVNLWQFVLVRHELVLNTVISSSCDVKVRPLANAPFHLAMSK